MLGIFGGETLEEIISNCVKVLSHCAKLPFSWHIFQEAQENVLEQVAKTLATIHTGVPSVAEQLHRPVLCVSGILGTAASSTNSLAF